MITISISSHNQQDYLPEAIESALRQPNCEVIVVDDGSTDNSLDIAKSYRIKVISQVNKGLPSARNTGLMNAQGDWLLYLDADDILLDNCVETIEKYINNDVDIIAPSFKEFGISNREVVLMDNPTIEDFKEANRIGYFSLVRKSKLLEIGGYSPRMIHGYEDYHIWFNLLTRGAKLKTIQDILVLYRTKEHSMIHDALEHNHELMGQINKDFKLW